MDKQKFGIIGSGTLSKTFGSLLVETGVYELDVVVGRSKASAEDCIRFVGEGTGSKNISDLGNCDLILVAVPDSALGDCCKKLQQAKTTLGAKMILHFSGACSSLVFSPLVSESTLVGSLHPLRAFSEPIGSLSDFVGTNCALEGAPNSIQYMRDLVALLQGESFELDEKSKLQYHAAAVFASNYLVASLNVSKKILEDLGLGEKFYLLQGLVQSATGDVFRSSPQSALTGPIERGDYGLVREQLREISHLPGVASLYRELGLQAVDIVEEKGNLAGQEIVKIKEALS